MACTSICSSRISYSPIAVSSCFQKVFSSTVLCLRFSKIGLRGLCGSESLLRTIATRERLRNSRRFPVYAELQVATLPHQNARMTIQKTFSRASRPLRTSFSWFSIGAALRFADLVIRMSDQMRATQHSTSMPG
jgi:hypothetical protein